MSSYWPKAECCGSNLNCSPQAHEVVLFFLVVFCFVLFLYGCLGVK